MLETVGRTVDGKDVVAGIYRMYETHGVPFVAIFAALERRNAIPDWCALFRESRSAGVAVERVLGKFDDAISDVWGPEFRNVVVDTLNLAIKIGYFDED